jgi:outer membrane immunogenic protein
MKRLFLGSVALVALGLGTPAAFAADMRVPAYAPPPPPAYTWSGCYIGGGGGYSTGRSTQYTTAGTRVTGPFGVAAAPGAVVPPAGVNITDQFNLSGFIGTGELGCNWQWGAWVFGVEGDGSTTNKEGQSFETQLVPFLGAGRGNWISQTQERWLVTARARLGLTNFWWFGPQTMVYVTGGGAWAKIDTSEFLPGTLATTTGVQQSNTRGGWTVGGGLEYAVGYGWSVKSEFLYVKFDDYTTFTNAPFSATGGNIAPRTNKLEDYIWRAGLNYKFW